MRIKKVITKDKRSRQIRLASSIRNVWRTVGEFAFLDQGLKSKDICFSDVLNIYDAFGNAL